MSHLKSIAFQSTEVESGKLRERLCGMTDDELIAFGKMVRGLSAPRVAVSLYPWKVQLAEALAEWRRRHPRRCRDRLRCLYIRGRYIVLQFGHWKRLPISFTCVNAI